MLRLSALLALVLVGPAFAQAPKPLKVLFLGDQGHQSSSLLPPYPLAKRELCDNRHKYCGPLTTTSSKVAAIIGRVKDAGLKLSRRESRHT